MKELIKSLCEHIAPPGGERALSNELLEKVRDVAHQTSIDRLGNVIATKNGDGPHVVLMAHADQSGVMIMDIADKGFLRIIGAGNLEPGRLVGCQVVFQNGVKGVVQLEANTKDAEIRFDHLFVDIGKSSKASASELVHIGLSGVMVAPFTELGATRICGGSIDNRVGCAIAITAFRDLAAMNRHVSVVFTAMQTVGARGVGAATFALSPDLALVVDAGPCDDVPGHDVSSTELGKGPIIQVMDGTAIVSVRIRRHLEESAKKKGIAAQFGVWPKGSADTDAGAIQLTKAGVAVGGVHYPARYVGSTSTVVDVQDAQNAASLIVEAASSYEG